MVVVFAALLAAASLTACKVENAGYVLRGAPGVTAEFRDVDSGKDWPSGLALGIHVRKSHRTYWFLPWDGGTDDLQNLASTTDIDAKGWRPPSPDDGPRPLGDLDYIAADWSYRILDRTPRRNEIAPAHILVPELGDRLWHSNFDPAPKQFFDLKRCVRRS